MTALRMAPTVRKVQSRLGYNFKTTKYIWEALQAPGSIAPSSEVEGEKTEPQSVGLQNFPDGNRRLAVLGDAVLRLALVEDWYKMEEGTRQRVSHLVSDFTSNFNLDMVGRTKGLDTLINRNPCDDKASIGAMQMATTVEAVIGAVYLDSDLKSVTEVMRTLGLMPRRVRRTRMNAPVSTSPAASTSTVDSHEKPEAAPIDLEERLTTLTESSIELAKSVRDYYIVAQLKERLDENTQSAS